MAEHRRLLVLAVIIAVAIVPHSHAQEDELVSNLADPAALASFSEKDWRSLTTEDLMIIPDYSLVRWDLVDQSLVPEERIKEIPAEKLNVDQIDANFYKHLTMEQIREQLHNFKDLQQLDVYYLDEALRQRFSLKLSLRSQGPCRIDGNGNLISDRIQLNLGVIAPDSKVIVMPDGDIRVFAPDGSETDLNSLNPECLPGNKITGNAVSELGCKIGLFCKDSLESGGDGVKFTFRGRRFILQKGSLERYADGRIVLSKSAVLYDDNDDLVYYAGSRPLTVFIDSGPQAGFSGNYAIIAPGKRVFSGKDFHVMLRNDPADIQVHAGPDCIFDDILPQQDRLGFRPSGGTITLTKPDAGAKIIVDIEGNAVVMNGNFDFKAVTINGKQKFIAVAPDLDANYVGLNRQGTGVQSVGKYLFLTPMDLNVNFGAGNERHYSIDDRGILDVLTSRDQKDYINGLSGKTKFVVDQERQILYVYKGNQLIYTDSLINVGPLRLAQDSINDQVGYDPTYDGEAGTGAAFSLGMPERRSGGSWHENYLPYGAPLRQTDNGMQYFQFSSATPLFSEIREAADGTFQVRTIDGGQWTKISGSWRAVPDKAVIYAKPFVQSTFYYGNNMGDVAMRLSAATVSGNEFVVNTETGMFLHDTEFSDKTRTSHGCINFPRIEEAIALTGQKSSSLIVIAHGTDSSTAQKLREGFISNRLVYCNGCATGTAQGGKVRYPLTVAKLKSS